MLTSRQINIICYFCNHDGWITSEQISQHFGFNKGTVQNEIRLITEYLGEECHIEVSPHSGYRLDVLTDNARKQIQEESARDGGKTNLGYRPSLFVMYLMFLQDYVTMQELADDLYMSKTAVSLEMETVKRWVRRYKGVTLEVSKRHGIRLYAEEFTKRMYVSSLGTVNT